jgi:hypothetical protein
MASETVLAPGRLALAQLRAIHRGTAHRGSTPRAARPSTPLPPPLPRSSTTIAPSTA